MNELPIRDIESEASVLGAMMLEEAALYTVLGIVKEEDFTNANHRVVFKACRDIAFRGETPDTVLVTAELESQGRRDLGGIALLALQDRVASTANVEAYCSLLVEKSRMRALDAACTMIKGMIHAPGVQPGNVLEEAESLIVDVGADAARVKVERVGDGWQAEHERMSQLATQRMTAGIPTGFVGYDKLTGGMHPGRFVVVGARPSVGKSALALNMAVNQAKSGYPVAVISLEMPKEELRARIVSSEGRIDSMALTTGIVSQQNLDKYATVMKHMDKCPLWLNDDHEMHLARLISTMRLLTRKMRVKVIYVDYIQLLTIVGFKGQRAEEVGRISRALKREAKKLAVTVVGLCQVNRESEKAGKKERPKIHHLRESGTIEQDADQILLLDPDEHNDSILTGYLDKNRGGPKGYFWLNFEAPYLRFTDCLDNRTEPEAEDKSNEYRTRK